MRKTIGATIIVLLLITVSNVEKVTAVSGKIWKQVGFNDFSKGTPEHTAVFVDGNITLAPSYRQIYQVKERPYIWDMAMDGQENLIIGAGTKASIYKISPDGKEIWKKGLEGLEVTAIAVGKSNQIYAAVSPGGKIYKISARGSISDYFDTKQRYVWDLAIGEDGNLYAATGSKGKIFKITAKEKGSMFAQIEDTHITTLISGKDDILYGGTDNKGYIFKIDRDGKIFILYDADEREVRSLLLDKAGNLFAATVNKSKLERVATKKEDPVLSSAKDREEGKVKIKLPPSVKPRAKGLKSSVYKIDRNYRVERILPSKKSTFYTLAHWKDNAILVGSGNEGRLYAYREKNNIGLIMDVEPKQIVSLVSSRSGKVYIATSNEALVYKIENGFSESGDFYSQVKDTGTISQWGVINWSESKSTGTNIRLFSRTGNTAKPDNTWSGWAGPYLVASGAKITSPPARFIQWRALLKTQEKNRRPLLKSVQLSYLPMNSPPRISNLKFYPKGLFFAKPVAMALSNPLLKELLTDLKNGSSKNIPTRIKTNLPKGKRTFKEGFLSFSWYASDPNGDTLSYSVSYKAENEKQWKLINLDEANQFYSWDTKTVPDGHYRIKIVASDLPNTPSEYALKDEIISDPVIIDNTGAEISKPTVSFTSKAAVIKFEIRDKLTPITHCRYAINGGKWNVVFPDDGIGDTLRETYTVTLKAKEETEYTIVIQARDGNYNYSTNSITFTK